MTIPISLLFLNLGLTVSLMIGLWLLSLVLKDASIADIFWGLGFVVIAWVTFAQAEGFYGRKLAVAVLVTLWGLRLALHIALRNRGKGEDRRYAAWRAKHGADFWWVSLFRVFLLQGLLLWTISLVIQAAGSASVPDRFVWLDGIGMGFWIAGFFFEAVADWQLARFKSKPANQGKVMNRGLWAYTRHPNYFGESLIWWGFFCMAVVNGMNLWTVISPLTITVLLLKVSGVSLLEHRIVERRPAYREYIRHTSPFIPWFPKKR